MNEEDFYQKFGDGYEEKHRRMVEQIEEAARDLGLYLDYARVMPSPESNGERLMVQTAFTIGDLAWSPKVQNPEQHAINKQFQDLTMDVEDDHLAEVRKSLEKLRDQGTE